MRSLCLYHYLSLTFVLARVPVVRDELVHGKRRSLPQRLARDGSLPPSSTSGGTNSSFEEIAGENARRSLDGQFDGKASPIAGWEALSPAPAPPPAARPAMQQPEKVAEPKIRAVADKPPPPPGPPPPAPEPALQPASEAAIAEAAAQLRTVAQGAAQATAQVAAPPIAAPAAPIAPKGTSVEDKPAVPAAAPPGEKHESDQKKKTQTKPAAKKGNDATQPAAVPEAVESAQSPEKISKSPDPRQDGAEESHAYDYSVLKTSSLVPERKLSTFSIKGFCVFDMTLNEAEQSNIAALPLCCRRTARFCEETTDLGGCSGSAATKCASPDKCREVGFDERCPTGCIDVEGHWGPPDGGRDEKLDYDTRNRCFAVHSSKFIDRVSVDAPYGFVKWRFVPRNLITIREKQLFESAPNGESSTLILRLARIFRWVIPTRWTMYMVQGDLTPTDDPILEWCFASTENTCKANCEPLTIGKYIFGEDECEPLYISNITDSYRAEVEAHTAEEPE